jgi:predicted RNA-binding Zn-ribbon protein involved in translation (DUF1610 family)
MFSNLEKNIKDAKNKFKCANCNFSTSSEPGLKTHMAKKHNKISFPQQCTLCDQVLNYLKGYTKLRDPLQEQKIAICKK